MTMRLALLAVLLSGCSFYFGGDDDGDDDCLYPAGATEPGIGYEIRDPNTGICQAWGGDYDCPDSCGPCPLAPSTPLPDWGMCYSACEGLDETSCRDTSGCYAAYLNDPANDGGPKFWGCWATAPSGPVQGSCTNLDAYECSRHDDCTATYESSTTQLNKFIGCAPEVVPVACETLATEAACTDRPDCTPVYDGDQCTCYPDGCDCEILTYTHCETR